MAARPAAGRCDARGLSSSSCAVCAPLMCTWAAWSLVRLSCTARSAAAVYASSTVDHIHTSVCVSSP